MSDKEFAVQKHVGLLEDGQKITFRKIFSELLFHRDVGQSKILQHNLPKEKESKYIHRGLIFVSIFVQVFLNHIAVPLKWFGSMIESSLNRNIIPGQREPSVGFISYLGHQDMRIELDKSIQPGDPRYYPALSMMASKLAYESKSVIQTVVSQHWKMEFVDFYNLYNEFQGKPRTQAYICREASAENDMTIVAFRGTSPFVADDWSTDFDFSWCKIKGMGRMHRGFLIALGLKKYIPDNDGLDDDNNADCVDYYGYWPKEVEKDDMHPLAYYTIREKLREIMANNKKAKFIVTGHSLGGALAILFPAILALHEEWDILDRLEGIYTYGQPRVGDEKFGQFMKRIFKEHNIKYYRIVYGCDMVPTVPWDNTLMTFKHFGTCIRFNSFYKGKIVQEEKVVQKNAIQKFFWLLKGVAVTIIDMVLVRLNAIWELIRGCFIGFKLGPDYREGWFVILLRVSAILTPGVMAHYPRDYVNSTRLASKDLFQDYDAFSPSPKSEKLQRLI